MTRSTVTIIPVTDAPWHDVQTVFGTRGDPSTCWCQYFKMDNAEWKSATRETCEPALQRQVSELNSPPGLVAYLDGEPVGWCAVEPRANYPRLGRGKVVQASPEPADDPSVWAVTCFVVRVGFRKRGIATALLTAAADHARANGARVLEGYPVDPDQRENVSAADLYYGIVTQFTASGFSEVSRPTPSRALMQLQFPS